MRKFIFIALFFIISCPSDSLDRIMQSPTLERIQLLEFQSIDTYKIHLYFNQDIKLSQINCLGNEIKYITYKPKQAILHTLYPLDISNTYYLDAKASTSSNTSLKFKIPISGFNTNFAKAIISEFSVKGTSSYPDAIELYIQRAGNLSGYCLYLGLKDNYTNYYKFKNYNVYYNDFVTLQVQKGNSRNISNLLEFSNLSGIKEGEGIISLYDPRGNLVDLVYYSNDPLNIKDTSSYNYITSNGYWKGLALDISNSSATKSLNRKQTILDQNNKDDWYISDLRKASFGYHNIEKE